MLLFFKKEVLPLISKNPPTPRRRFAHDRSSLASLEFAIVLPLMLALLAGVYDLSETAIIRAEVTNAAQSMAASASSLAVQQDGSTALTWQQVQQVESSIWALIPSLRNGQKNGSPKFITMSSVLFYPNLATSCGFHVTGGAACQFNADIVWSVAYAPTMSNAGFSENLPTNCNVVYGQNQSSADQVSAATTLSGTNNLSFFRTLDIATSTATADGWPANEAGVPPMLAVTIQYTYTPLFGLVITKPYTFWVDGYWPVRSVKKTAPGSLLSDIVPPLSQQYTTLVGSTANNTLSGSPAAGSYCLNSGAAPISNPVS